MNNSKIIIDVRSEGEFLGGHAEGSINIPLNELESRLEELKELKGEFILCCASGNRSGMAHAILVQKGIKCINGGSWYEASLLMENV
jgi:phage shock protein E